MEQKVYSISDGMSTGPDVAKLMESFPNLKTGDKIPYTEVEAIIGGHDWRTNRFKSVTRNWRKRMMDEKGVIIDCLPGSAFIVLSDAQITEGTHGVLRHIGKSAKKQFSRLTTISNTVSDEMKCTRDHQMRLMDNIHREVKKSRLNILPNMDAPLQIQARPTIVDTKQQMEESQ